MTKIKRQYKSNRSVVIAGLTRNRRSLINKSFAMSRTFTKKKNTD